MRCKQGDMAFILRSVTGLNDGKVVDVKQYIGYLQAQETFDHNGITCRAPITDHYWWIFSQAGLETYYGTTSLAYSPDTWLKPLPPDILTDEDKQENSLYTPVQTTIS